MKNDDDVQLFMNIYDIKPTESFWDKVDDRKLYKEDARLWQKQELIDNIREHGIKYQLNVDEEGNIKNGNMRYWVARYLLEEEHDQRFLYLPVQRNYASGAFYKEFGMVIKDPHVTQEEIDKIGDKIAIDIHDKWINYTRELTLPSREKFAVLEIDPIDEFRMKNFWDQQRNIWQVFLQPSPNNKKTMVCFGIAGKSSGVPAFKNGTAQERKAFKTWYKKVREERQTLGPRATLHRERKKMHGDLKVY